jgi:hypothetical protein
MVTPVVATGSKVRFARYSGVCSGRHLMSPNKSDAQGGAGHNPHHRALRPDRSNRSISIQEATFNCCRMNSILRNWITWASSDQAANVARVDEPSRLRA